MEPSSSTEQDAAALVHEIDGAGVTTADPSISVKELAQALESTTHENKSSVEGRVEVSSTMLTTTMTTTTMTTTTDQEQSMVADERER